MRQFLSSSFSFLSFRLYTCLSHAFFTPAGSHPNRTLLAFVANIFFCCLSSCIVFFLWHYFSLPDYPLADTTAAIVKPDGWRTFVTLVLPFLAFVPTSVLFYCQKIAPRPESLWRQTLKRELCGNYILALVWITIPCLWKFSAPTASSIGFVFIFWLFLKCYASLPWLLHLSQWNTRNALCCICIVFYLAGGVAVWASRSSTYSDAVQYMLFTHSLVKHQTFDVSQTVDKREYKAFYWGRWHREFIHKNPGEIHATLTPFAFYIPYALGGRLGILLFFSLLVALSTALVTSFIVNLGIAPPRPAIQAALIGMSTCPVVFLSHVEFPDTVGLFLFSLSLYIFSKNCNILIKIPSLLSLSLLSYFIKSRLIIGFAGILLALLHSLILHTTKKRGYRFIFTFLLYGVTIILFFMAIQRKGLWNNYPHFDIIYSTLAGIFAGQNFGLFFAAPVFMLSVISLTEAYWYSKDVFRVCILPLFTSIFLLIGLNWFAWHGGFSPPYRYLMYTLPVWIALLAYWTAAVESWRRILVYLLTIWGLFYTCIGIVFPLLKTNRPIGANDLLLFLGSVSHSSLFSFFPSIFMRSGQMNIWCLAWLCTTIFLIFLIKIPHSSQSPLSNKRKKTILLIGYCFIVCTFLSGIILYKKINPRVIIEAEMMTSTTTSLWSPTNPLYMRGRVFTDTTSATTDITLAQKGLYRIEMKYIAQTNGTADIYFNNILLASMAIQGTATPENRKADRERNGYGLTRGQFPARKRSASTNVELKKGPYTVRIEYHGKPGKQNWFLLDCLLLAKEHHSTGNNIGIEKVHFNDMLFLLLKTEIESK